MLYLLRPQGRRSRSQCACGSVPWALWVKSAVPIWWTDQQLWNILSGQSTRNTLNLIAVQLSNRYFLLLLLHTFTKYSSWLNYLSNPLWAAFICKVSRWAFVIVQFENVNIYSLWFVWKKYSRVSGSLASFIFSCSLQLEAGIFPSSGEACWHLKWINTKV